MCFFHQEVREHGGEESAGELPDMILATKPGMLIQNTIFTFN